MAKQKQEDPPKGSPAWMATFSDLMNLLLCFFVLLFSMSTVSEEKFQAVIASLQSHFSVLQGGASSIGDGEMVASGINQLQYYDTFYNPDANSQGKGQFDEEGHMNNADDVHTDGVDSTVSEDGNQNASGETTAELTDQEILDRYEQQALQESEKMAEKMGEQIARYGLQDQVEVDFNAQYVMLTLNGAVLFDTGSEIIRTDAIPLVDKVGKILDHYVSNIIEVEGHTDNVPIHNSRFEEQCAIHVSRPVCGRLSAGDHIR